MAEMKHTINVTYKNHPKTIPLTPPWSEKKLSSMKLIPGAEKVEDHCYRGQSVFLRVY